MARARIIFFRAPEEGPHLLSQECATGRKLEWAGFELNAPPRVPRAIFSCENFDPTARPFVRVCPPPKWGSFDSAWHAQFDGHGGVLDIRPNTKSTSSWHTKHDETVERHHRYSMTHRLRPSTVWRLALCSRPSTRTVHEARIFALVFLVASCFLRAVERG